MSLRGNLIKHIVGSSLSSLQLLCCVKCILILCRSWLGDFIISKMLSLESGNEVQEKMWIVFCKHTQSWWTFNYQPLSGTSWAGLQEKGKWQHGVWAPPMMSSAWKDVDCLQHTALSRTGMERCFCSCHRTEGLCAWCPFFLKHSLPLSGPLFSLPSLPPAAGALPIPSLLTAPPCASSLNSPQPPHSTVAAAPSSISPLGTSPAASQPCDVMGPWTWRQVHGYPLPPSEGGLGRAQCSQSGDSNHVLLTQLLNGMAPPNHSYPAVSHKGRHICLPKDKASLCSAHIAPSLPQFCFWTDPPCPRTMSLPISCRPPLKTTFY